MFCCLVSVTFLCEILIKSVVVKLTQPLDQFDDHILSTPQEAILVKNIIVEMHNSMSILTDLVRYLRRHDYTGLGSWEERLEPELVDLLMLLANQGPNSIANSDHSQRPSIK